MSGLGELRKSAVREALWRAELAGWLHNIGKLTSAFVEYSRHIKPHVTLFRHEYIAGTLRKSPAAAEQASPIMGRAALLEHSAKCFAEESAGAFEPIFDTPVTIEGLTSTTIGHLIEYQNFDWFKPGITPAFPGGDEAARLPFLLALSHRQASGQDKTDQQWESERSGDNKPLDKALRKKGQDTLPWYRATPFGYETEVGLSQYPVALKQIAEAILAHPKQLIIRSSLRQRLYELLNVAIADSRRPINDTRVGDMGKMAAAFFKSQIAHDIVTGSHPENRQWRLVRVALDGPGFVSAAIRSADAIARRDHITWFLNRIQKELEDYTPIANEVYRDEFGAIYVCADFGPARDLAKLITEAIHFRNIVVDHELPYELQLSQPFAMGAQGGYSFCLLGLLDQPPPSYTAAPSAIAAAWSGRPDTPLCSVCRLRPLDIPKSHAARQRCCKVCFNRRVGRAKRWIGEPSTTIWLDEVADANGRIALLSARLRLDPWLVPDNGYIEQTLFFAPETDQLWRKGASAARVARIWETARDFWSAWRQILQPDLMAPPRLRLSGSAQIDEQLQFREGQTYNLIPVELPKLKISVVCLDTGFRQVMVVDNLQRLARLGGFSAASCTRGAQFHIEEPTGYGSPDKFVGIFTLDQDAVAGDTPFAALIPLLQDPMLMMAVLPAEKALSAAHKLRDLYAVQMGKVANRLGLDISIVWAPVDTPLAAVLDAARRSMRRKLLSRSEALSAAHFENWPGHKHDEWYRFVQTPAGQTRSINDCQTGDLVQWEPSTFDFEFLDSASRRFDLAYSPATHQRRDPALKHRPYPLQQLETFHRTRTLLKTHLALGEQDAKIHQLKNLDGLLDQKRELWQCKSWDQLDRTFIEWALCNVEWPKPAPGPEDLDFLIGAIQSGIFADVLEIELGIRKSGRH